MDVQPILNALLIHLTETTGERDQARAEVAGLRADLDQVQARLAEIEATFADPDPPPV